jgi:hypothetical protein
MSNKEPDHNIRRGNVEAAIWRNDGSNGSYHKATFTRVYKDGDEYKDSDSFGTTDAIILGNVATLAADWMAENRPAKSWARLAISARITRAFFLLAES